MKYNNKIILVHILLLIVIWGLIYLEKWNFPDLKVFIIIIAICLFYFFIKFYGYKNENYEKITWKKICEKYNLLLIIKNINNIG